MTNPYGVQNNVQTAVTVDGNVIEPRQLICHTEMIQPSFIYTASLTVKIFSRNFSETQSPLQEETSSRAGTPLLMAAKGGGGGGGAEGEGVERGEEQTDMQTPHIHWESSGTVWNFWRDKLLSLSSVWRRGRSGLSIHAWEFVKCPPRQLS